MQNNTIYKITVNGLIHPVVLKIVNIGVYKEGPYIYFFKAEFIIPSWKGRGWNTKDGTEYFLGATEKMAIEWMEKIKAIRIN
jgi:hypothetical protein